MQYFWRGLLKFLIKFTGLLANILEIYSFTVNTYSYPDNLKIPFYPILMDHDYSILIIGFALIGMGVCIWDWLNKHASTPFQSFRLFICSQTILAAGLLFVHSQTFDYPFLSIQFLAYLIISVIISGTFSYNLHQFLTLSKTY